MTKVSKRQWQQQLVNLGKTTDGLGLGIDPGIIELVAGLNLIGVNTTASCEGHLDWGLPYPWIDIEGIGAFELNEKMQKVKADSNDHKALITQLIKINSVEVKKLFEILEEYNNQKSHTYRRILIIVPFGWGSGRFQPVGGVLAEISNKTEQAKQLEIFRNEIKQFSRFIKQKLGLIN